MTNISKGGKMTILGAALLVIGAMAAMVGGSTRMVLIGLALATIGFLILRHSMPYAFHLAPGVRI